MSKTLAVALSVALLWLTGWSIGGYFMRQVGTEKLALAKRFELPTAQLEPGADIRVEGVIVDGPSVEAPYSKKPCLAGIAHVSILSQYRDIHDRPANDSRTVATRRTGPANIEIAVGDKRLELPLDRWVPRDYTHDGPKTVPEHMGVAEQELEDARKSVHDGSKFIHISEATILGGTRVFVAGRLEVGTSSLRLEPDRELGRVEIVEGTQEAYATAMRGSGGGLQTAAWILVGIGTLPFAVIGVVLWIRGRRRQSVPVSP